MKTVIVPTQLRVPREVRDWVKEKAHKLDRSMNWVMVNVLKQAKEREENETK